MIGHYDFLSLKWCYMNNKTGRDDFQNKTKSALAARANYRCSFPGCEIITCGPSSESSSAVTNIGVAAHICAAAVGGRRYDKNMSKEQRSDIENGIWLCQTHATMIDRDDKTFTPEVLIEMKKSHEQRVQAQLYNLPRDNTLNDLFMIGDELIVLGCFKEFNTDFWVLEIKEYIRGTKFDLVDYISDFSDLTTEEKIIISESFSDGRQLTQPPAIIFENGNALLKCNVSLRAKLISVEEIGYDLALDDTGDLGIFSGELKTVGGLDRLPQLLFIYLSTIKGEIPRHPKLGVRLGEYYHLFKNTIWFNKIFKLEIIKAATINIDDDGLTTPLKCIQKVYDVEVRGEIDDKSKLSIFLSLEVKGYGLWEREIKVYIPTDF